MARSPADRARHLRDSRADHPALLAHPSLEAVEHHLREPERVPDVHAGSATSNAKVLDGWVVWRNWVEDGVKVGGREVGISGRVEKGDEQGGE